MKIYDCFNFFNELDILDIRLNELYNHVDYFVIVESSVTHTGITKPFYFEENKHIFSKFLDKIIHFKIVDTPTEFVNLPNTNDKVLQKVHTFINNPHQRWFDRYTQPDYGRDFFQKESMRRPLVECNDNDIILVSDADEIADPRLFRYIRDGSIDFNCIYSLNQPMYYYYVNMLKDPGWKGTRLLKYEMLKNLSINDIRGDRHNIPVTTIQNAGWHFSFMGGSEMVRKKLISYSANDMVNENVLLNIDKNISDGIDPFNRGNLTQVNITEKTHPLYILNNTEKFTHLIKC